MKSIILIFSVIKDLFLRVLPSRHNKGKGFAFLVHARDLEDVYKKYPFTNKLPENVIHWLILRIWPVVVADITGLVDRCGHNVEGWLIGFPMTAHQMMENRELALKKIIQSAQLAQKKGASIIGLGALTSSLSHGGASVINKVSINVTTGHAYTVHIVCNNFFKLVELMNFKKNDVTVAIVGAAGSVGSTSAKVIVRAGYLNIVLVDLERKNKFLDDLTATLKEINNNVNIFVSHQISSINKADFIITATNAPEVVIHADDLKSGAVIIDDAQPSDVSPDVLDREDVLLVDAGIVNTPGITTHFDLGLNNKYNNFCCLGELLALCAIGWDKHYVIGRANLELVDEIARVTEELGFSLAKFQNKNGIITDDKLQYIKNIHSKNF